MAQNITIAGAAFSAVPAIEVPKTGGGIATFSDPSGTTAAASDVAQGKLFLDASGVLTTGTASGGGGTDKFVLLKTESLGSLSTTNQSSTDTGKTIQLAQSSGWQDYDFLLVDISVDTVTNGRHTSSVTSLLITGTSDVGTKNTYTVLANVWNSRLNSSGTASSRQSTTKYGVYINAASASNNTLTLAVYYRYSSNYSGTINGNYTARVYGIKLIDLIGG